MPQLSSADSKGFPMTGIPGPENSFLSGSLIHEDQNPERLDNNVTPRSVLYLILNREFSAEDVRFPSHTLILMFFLENFWHDCPANGFMCLSLHWNRNADKLMLVGI